MRPETAFHTSFAVNFKKQKPMGNNTFLNASNHLVRTIMSNFDLSLMPRDIFTLLPKTPNQFVYKKLIDWFAGTKKILI